VGKVSKVKKKEKKIEIKGKKRLRKNKVLKLVRSILCNPIKMYFNLFFLVVGRSLRFYCKTTLHMLYKVTPGLRCNHEPREKREIPEN
jgi:hypothetical protein